MFNQVPGRWIVIGVTTLITFLAVTAQWFILLPFFAGMDSMLTAKTLIPLNIGLCMIYINYYLACTVDPGEVPATWEPPYAVLEEHAPQGLTGPRFCKTCQVYKPPRAHHCRYCQRCILKMDHHCPWINNCVGHDNYGHFLRFVFWVDVTCSYALSLLIWRMYAMMDSNRLDWDFMQPTLFETVFLIVDIAAIVIVILCVGILSIYHLYCICRGQTTIEGRERTKVKRLIRRRKIAPIQFPFDVGIYRNISAVLGSNPLLWMWPQRMGGDGLSFPVRRHTDLQTPYIWPPRDPDDLRPSIYERMDNEVAKGRTQLVRRDSEGYLVREITMEDRMHMLEERQMMPEYDEAYAPDFHEEGFALENAYADENTFAEQEFMTGEDPAVVEDYLYDSGSFGTGSDDDERYTDEEGDHIMNQDTATICETDPLVERNDSPYTEKHDILSSTAGSDNCPGDSELPNNER